MIKEINSIGQVIIAFSHDLLEITKDLSVYYTNSTKSFTLTYLSNNLEEKEREEIIRNWHISSRQSNQMTL